MKVNDLLHAGAFRFTRAVLVVLLVYFCIAAGSFAYAASWQWRTANGREELNITLDSAPQSIDFGRTGTNMLTVSSADFANISQFAHQGGIFGPRNLIAGVSLDDGQINVRLNSAGFGYIVTQPAPNQIKAEFFPDRLGTRWKDPAASTTQSQENGNAGDVNTPLASAQTKPLQTKPLQTNPLQTAAQQTTVQPVQQQALGAASTAPAPSTPPKPSADNVRPGVIDPAKFATGVGSAPTQEMPAQSMTGKKSNARQADEKLIAPVPSAPENTVAPGLSAPADAISAENTSPVPTILPSDRADADAVATVSPDVSSDVVVPWTDRGRAEAAFSVVGKVNSGGPETWPAEQGISTDSKSLEEYQNANAAQQQALTPDSASISSEPVPPQKTPESTVAVSAPPTSDINMSPEAQQTAPNLAATNQNATENTSSSTLQAASPAPEALPTETAPTGSDAAKAAKDMKAVTAEAKAPSVNATRPIVYVDEKGNPVPPPPIPRKVLTEARDLMEDKKYAAALPVIDKALSLALSRPDREEALYLRSEALESIHAKNPLGGYEQIVAATNEAMNYNLRSPRVPQALTRLGKANLHVDNLTEAEAYFAMMRNQYPRDAEVPGNYYLLGMAQLDKDLDAQAAEQFSLVLQEYPDSSSIKLSAFHLMTALYKQNLLEQASVIESFIEKRWPRLYLEQERYLPMAADIRFRLKHLNDALRIYWTYFNLYPDNPENHLVLWRLGDLYLMKNNIPAARKVFQENIARFPDTEGAIVAQLRLAENGIHDDDFTLKEMFAVFDANTENKPEKTYATLIEKYPNTIYGRDARLKAAMWQLWNRQYLDALAAADALKETDPFQERALDIMRQAVSASIENALVEGNDERILHLWEQYPLVKEMFEPLPADIRAALARAHVVRKNEDVALDLLKPFLESPKDPRYGEYALGLFFGKYLREQDWNALLDLYEKVQNWDLPVRTRNQLDYVMALSAENLGLSGKALPMWEQLAVRNDIPLFQKAYASYYLAREAERRRDLKHAYDLNIETLKLFTSLQEERSDKADPARVQESIGSLMEICEVAGRIAESLEWADKYAAFVPEESPDFVGLRFRIARLHRKLGDTSKWRALLEDIVRREPESVFGRMASSELRTIEVSRDLSRFAPESGGGEKK